MFNWFKFTHNWFSHTERSSGFRPYLIFVILHVTFAGTSTRFLGAENALSQILISCLWITLPGFVGLFAVKCFQDPEFCRSEKHVETVRRLQLAEQSDNRGPIPISESVDREQMNPEPKLEDKG